MIIIKETLDFDYVKLFNQKSICVENKLGFIFYILTYKYFIKWLLNIVLITSILCDFIHFIDLWMLDVVKQNYLIKKNCVKNKLGFMIHPYVYISLNDQ